MTTPYEAFGRAAERLITPALVVGRHSFHTEVEPLIVHDVIQKLRPQPDDRLLEVGCGLGALLTPLSIHVSEATGIDHPSCIRRYTQSNVPDNVKLIPGEWPATQGKGTFDRILVYSVLHYLPNAEAAREFIYACLSVLNPSGSLMLGDIPNLDRQRRFSASKFGKRFDAEWAERKATLSPEHHTRDQIFAETERNPPFLSDDFIVELLADTRRRGMESHVVGQPEGLPMCYSREDVLIWKHA